MVAEDTLSTRQTARNPLADEQSGAAPVESIVLVTLAGHGVGRIYPLGAGRTLIGRDEHVDVQVLDDRVSRRHAAIDWNAGRQCFELSDLESSNGTMVNGALCRATHRLKVGDKIRLGRSTVLRLSHVDEVETRFAERMNHVALRDPLTDAYNRRYLQERLVEEIAYARRHECALSLMMLDIDHFKSINDTFGHLAGDAVLQQLAERLHRNIRAEDVLVRYGGEEFVVLCRDTDVSGAVVAAGRLRATVERQLFALGGTEMAVTVSIGVAGWDPSMRAAEELIGAADAAAYRAKAAGRNRVMRHEPGR
ncbi:MAG: GGDEF domain-containing protein [Deltaproteobacteria bacterium]|nr:GGDEF domain-containing protein [Deltaproteobacteria bacterium]